MKWVFLLLIPLTFCLVLVTAITMCQERLFYRPDIYRTAALLDGYRWVAHNGTQMQLPKQGLTKKVAVLYHGNAGAVAHRTPLARAVVAGDYSLLAVEYAGYGADTTRPTHERIKEDVRNIINFLHEHQVTDYVLIGESIGTGISAHHTSLDAPRKLILLSPFTNLPDVFAANSGVPVALSRILIDNAFDTVADLHNYRGDILILHGEKDLVIPFEQGQRLSRSLPKASIEFKPMTGAGHELFNQAGPTLAEMAVVEFLKH